MKPEIRSTKLLGVTRSKAKMFEYSIADEHHIEIARNPAHLFRLTISIIGDLSAAINSEDEHLETIERLQQDLIFSAQFFDAYIQSKLDQKLDTYLLLIGSASYYLCDLSGSATVLSSQLPEDSPDLDCLYLEDLLLWLVKADFSTYFSEASSVYEHYVIGISKHLVTYYETGNNSNELIDTCNNLREFTYSSGTDRQLLFADIICAIIKKRVNDSTWKCLPQYSGLPSQRWEEVIKKDSFIKEFWPAQRLLGEQGVFKGESVVVQMPTSAGKTKSIEIIIRSAFLSERTSLAVIIAPFRALCQEICNDLIDAFSGENIIVDEPSDALQMDIDILDLFKSLGIENKKQVLVLTPEKFLYILRHTPELSDHIGLLIYDEGHQFDSGTRGITYELLLSSLRQKLSHDTQTVLISAVISNAEDIGNWLNGEGSKVVAGSELLPTYRTLAFASWQDKLGRLEFVNQNEPESQEYFVPRVIEQQELQLIGKERKRRFFPDKTKGTDIALYFGVKLVSNGSVAIFCGQKATVASLCEKIIDTYNRGLVFPMPSESSDETEISKLHYLHISHFGENYAITKSAEIGVFAHSGNTPQGLRLAIEYAMQNNLIKFVICTSTLAQGVNLPIRYLIVTSIYQAGSRIKVRDFHNLIGRAGRAGMHTEGSIIFADPVVYDKRKSSRDNWRWKEVKKVLNPKNSEACDSTLFSLFEPFISDDKNTTIIMEALDFVKAYINNPEQLVTLAKQIAKSHADKKFSTDGLMRQIDWKINIISTIESYLMSHLELLDGKYDVENIALLARGTLAYYLATEEQRHQIIELFQLLANNIEENIPDQAKRLVYGKTLFGVNNSIEIEQWVKENIDELNNTESDENLISLLWSLLLINIKNKTFNKCSSDKSGEFYLPFVLNWMNGESFLELHNFLLQNSVYIAAGKQKRKLKLDHIVELTEGALAYEGMLVLAAVSEIVAFIEGEESELSFRLNGLQKRLKYGLPSKTSIILYELGFSDRVIAISLAEIIEQAKNKNKILRNLQNKKNKVTEVLDKFPSYFEYVFNKINN